MSGPYTQTMALTALGEEGGTVRGGPREMWASSALLFYDENLFICYMYN